MKLLSTHRIPLRWVDMDLYHHVNNARYFDFMTEARAQLFVEIMQQEVRWQFILVDVHCNFRKTFVYPDTVILKQYSEKVGSKSFSLAYEFFSTQHPDQIHATGEAKLVCFDAELGKAVTLPEIIRQLLTDESI